MTLQRSSPDVDASRVGDRLVLYHRGTRKALVLNPTGSWLWDQLAAGCTSEQLADALVARWPALGRDRASADASAFLDELGRHDMLLSAVG